jgi:hypothetical protein
MNMSDQTLVKNGQRPPERRRLSIPKAVGVAVSILTIASILVGGFLGLSAQITAQVTDKITNQKDLEQAIKSEAAERSKDDQLEAARRDALEKLIGSKLDNIDRKLDVHISRGRGGDQ